MARFRRTVAFAVLAGVAAPAVGCGTQAPKAGSLSQWLTYNAVRRTATITVIPAYNHSYNGFNFNGYSKGQVAIVVPIGWTITVRCSNTGAPGRHSCAIVSGAGATRPAFRHASSPDPSTGLDPGRTAVFSFRPTRPGTYRIASLVPEQERAGMWDVLEITPTRLPSVILLRRPP